ncbi:30S ribosomal protein S26e [Candidatus Bathyarchaeota archaeon]|nr:30S ribosomal protein S26e [Candidatus Bathyarchaeota archaeon]
MPQKRKNRGRSRGAKGSSGYVHCSGCGELVPRDKAKKITRRISLVDPVLAKELRQKGAYIATRTETLYYCVSCAVYRGLVRIRSRKERKLRTPLRRR